MKTKVKRIMAYVLSFAMVAAFALNVSVTDSQAAKKYVKSLKVSKSVTVSAGKSKTVKAKVKVVKKASSKIKATSSNKKIAAVKVKGKKITISGKKEGKAVITVKTVAKGKKGKVLSKKIKVTVKGKDKPVVVPTQDPVVVPTQAPAVVSSAPPITLPTETVTLDNTAVTVAQTEGIRLVATVVPATTIVEWSSSNPAVAVVDSTGYVTGTGIGTADITAKAGSAVAVCKVTVVEKKYTVKSISAVNTDEGTISITFEEEVDTSVLNGTKVTITSGSTKVSAVFKQISDDGKSAVYEFSKEDLAKIQSGNYSVESDNMNISEEVSTTSARVDIKGSSVKGLVYYKDYSGEVYQIPDASITVNGESVRTDENGFYQKGLPGDRYNATVKAEGFFDETKEDIIVSANKASAYNFSMEMYDVEKVYLYGTVCKDDDSASVISDAKVSLYEITDGKETLKAVVNTDSNGKFVFANSDADYSKIDVAASSAEIFSYAYGMSKKCEYRVEITKNLSSNNLFDVYEPYASKQFDLGSARGIDVGTAMKKVEPISEMTLQLSWDGELTSKGDVEISFLDTDGKTLLKNNVMTIADEYFESKTNRNQMKSGEYKLIAEKFFSDATNVKPTLPEGTYYLVVKTMDADDSYIDSTVVCPVQVTPGSRADAEEGLVTEKIDRDITYQANFSDEFGTTAQKNQTTVLNTLADNEGTLSNSAVTFNSNIYQVVDGVNVLINATSGNKLEKSNNVFIKTYKQENLAKGKEYYVETEKTHIVNGDKKFSTSSTDSWNVQFTAAANVTYVKFSGAECFIDKLNTDNTAALTEKVHVNAVTINVTPADTSLSNVSREIQIDKEFTVSQLVNSGIPLSEYPESKGLPVGKYTLDFDFENFTLDSEYSKDSEDTVIDLQNAVVECNARYEKVYPTTISGVVSYGDTSKTMSDNGVAVLYTEDFRQIVAAADFEVADDQVVYSLVDGEDGDFEGGSYKLLIRGEGIDYTVKDVTVATNEVKKNIDFRELEVGGSTSMKPTIKTNSGSGLDSSATAIAYDKYYIDPWDAAVDYYAFRCLLGNDYNGCIELDRVDGSDISWIRKNVSKGDYTLVVDSDITDEKAFNVTLKNTYEDELTVAFTVYDNLVRINLVLSNKGTDGAAFTAGQLDYITAVSEDGTVSYDGIFLREKADDDAGYFYVPKGKAYTITVYSDKNYVTSESKVAQYNESESIYLTCQAVQQ